MQFNYLFSLKNAFINSSGYNFWTQKCCNETNYMPDTLNLSAPCIILASLPSLCQKLLVAIWRSCDKNNFAQFSATRCKRVYTMNYMDLAYIAFVYQSTLLAVSVLHRFYRTLQFSVVQWWAKSNHDLIWVAILVCWRFCLKMLRFDLNLRNSISLSARFDVKWCKFGPSLQRVYCSAVVVFLGLWTLDSQ